MERHICTKCGKPIPKGRLDAIPDVQTCVKCSDYVPPDEDTDGIVDGAEQADLQSQAYTPQRESGSIGRKSS